MFQDHVFDKYDYSRFERLTDITVENDYFYLLVEGI